MKFASAGWLVAGAVLAMAAPARATQMTLPLSRFIVNVPDGWSVHRAYGATGQDVLRSDTGGTLAVGATDVGCGSFFSRQEGAVGTLTAATPSYAPSGWEVRSFTKGDATGYLGCHEVAGVTVGAQWWALPSAEANNQSKWEGEMTAALTAFDGMRRAGRAAARDDLVTLPGSGLTIQVPESMRIETGDPDTAKDTFLKDGEPALVIAHAAAGSCDDAMTKLGATPSSEATYKQWRRWNDEGSEAYCRDTGGLVVVIGVRGEASTLIVLDSIMGEQGTPETGSVEKLPGSGWLVALPKGWSASAAGGTTTISGGDGTLTVQNASGSCEALTAVGGAREKYDPSWLSGDWKAVFDTGAGHAILCAKNDDGLIEVDAPEAMFQGGARRTTVAFLDSLHSQGTTHEPEIPHDPILPFPLEISLQTISGTERGWGPRGGFRLRLASVLSLHGEIGWDSVNGLSYDGRASFHLPLGENWMVYSAVGRDAIGDSTTTGLGSEWYYGVGGQVGAFKDDNSATLYFEYLWRAQPDATATVPLDENLYPGNEWRLGAQGYWGGEGRSFVQGLFAEWRSAGQAGTFLIGFSTRL